MVQRIFMLFTELPSLMRLGVVVLATGGALDLLYHAAPLGWAVQLDSHLGTHGAGAHLVTLLGMIVTLLSLFVRRASVQIAHMTDTASERRTPIEH